MLWNTHLLAGGLAGLAVARVSGMDPWPAALFATVTAVGALLPDCDTPSKSSRIVLSAAVFIVSAVALFATDSLFADGSCSSPSRSLRSCCCGFCVTEARPTRRSAPWPWARSAPPQSGLSMRPPHPVPRLAAPRRLGARRHLPRRPDRRRSPAPVARSRTQRLARAPATSPACGKHDGDGRPEAPRRPCFRGGPRKLVHVSSAALRSHR